MEKHSFIDRYFHSQYELLDIRFSEERDSNTLLTYLENLHSTGDKLKDLFKCDIKGMPEFKLLRLIRNYFHHVGDINEQRMLVSFEGKAVGSYSEHVIIPLESFARSIKSFIDNNTVSKKNRNYQKKIDFISKEIASINEFFDCQPIVENLSSFCENPQLKLDGVIYSLGFDMYKSIYNMSNIIAEKCRAIEELNCKKVILELDDSYMVKNNIEKNDTLCHLNHIPILTTKGYVFADSIELVLPTH